MRARWVTSFLLLTAVLVLGGCGNQSGQALDGEEPATGVTEVGMENLQFKPRVIEVPVGTKVTWLFNDGGIPHNVIGDDFKSPTQAEGTFEYTFTQPGTYDYVCDLHPNMKGRVIVK